MLMSKIADKILPKHLNIDNALHVAKSAPFVAKRRVARMLRVWRTHHPYADFFFFLADAFLDCARHEYKNTDEEKRAFWPAVYV